jgi:hypothetical protein
MKIENSKRIMAIHRMDDYSNVCTPSDLLFWICKIDQSLELVNAAKCAKSKTPFHPPVKIFDQCLPPFVQMGVIYLADKIQVPIFGEGKTHVGIYKKPSVFSRKIHHRHCYIYQWADRILSLDEHGMSEGHQVFR